MNGQLSLFDIASEFYEDKNIDKLDLDNLSFKVHASLIYKLGEALISDEITALSELVKNSYDADSSYVELFVDSEYEEKRKVLEINDFKENLIVKSVKVGKIIVKDEGHGMDLNDIVNGWLTISNSPKKKMKKNKQVTEIFHRMPLGDKGLGRLSVQRLGRNMTLITKKKGSDKEFTVKIPWGDFLKNTTIENIPVKCETKVVNEKIDKSYTEIIITDLLNLELWNKNENVDELERQLSKIVSPFNVKNNTFYIYAKVGKRELDFTKILDEVLNTAISNYSFKVSNGRVLIEGFYKKDFFQTRSIFFQVMDDHIKEFLGLNNSEFENIKYLSDVEDKIYFSHEFDLLNISGFKTDIITNQIIYPGDFSGKIYSYYLDLEYLNAQIASSKLATFEETAQFKKFMERNKGIKVFRDDFGIQGYGHGENGDWLGLTVSAATTGKYIDLKNETVIGYISLSGKENYNLKEKTDREGFINDEYFYNFKLILQNIIKRINNNRRILNDGFREYANRVMAGAMYDEELPAYKNAINKVKSTSSKSKAISDKIKATNDKITQSKSYINTAKATIDNINVPDKEKEKLNKLLEQLTVNINNSVESLDNASRYMEEVKSLEGQLFVIQEDYNVLSNQIEDISELAGLGMVAETLTHELNTLVKNIKDNTDEISTYFVKQYGSDKRIEQFFNYINYFADAIRKQVAYLSPSFRNVRTIKEYVNIKTLVENHMEFYRDRSIRKNISLIIKNIDTDFAVNVNVGMFNQVLDNLYSNAEHWLEHAMKLGEIKKGEYYIEIKPEGVLFIWDNGYGIDRSIENHIFEP